METIEVDGTNRASLSGYSRIEEKSQPYVPCPPVTGMCGQIAAPHCSHYHGLLQSNLFEWHFTLRGPPDTEFEGGIYHGRIILPTGRRYLHQLLHIV